MKRQIFRVSEQTHDNLTTAAAAVNKSKSDLIRTKIASAVKYVNEFDVRQNRIGDLCHSIRRRKAADAPIDDAVDELLNALDERTAHGDMLEDIFKPEDALKQHQIPVILSSEQNEQLENLVERFRIPKQDVVAAVINHNWDADVDGNKQN